MATGGYNASFEETQTGFGNESYEERQQENGKGYSGASATPLVGIDYKKHEDLKNMLDGNKDGLKLDAMKIIVGMVAKGKDCSDLFPAVVKNVVTKDPEIKKLVFVYLVRYAEEQQDVALLSISTFQKALKDPNQLIRASALRVLSSIRVPIIAPILMLSIKDSVMDMSPYVRKTAANAIPKLFSLDPEQKEPLVEIIEKLLKDQTTLVAGSVVTAFELVCPERIDLIHKNYRKLSNLLVDVDEWGQVAILNMLTRYARSQFIDPNLAELTDEKFYASSENSEEESEDDDDDDDDGSEEEGTKKKKKKKEKKKPYIMDADHRLLLRVTKSLLQSRNSAVVMAVAQLYHHVAPRNEVTIIARPLIRLLKGHYEVQSIVLSNIATLSAERPSMFEPYLKSFFVRSSDPTHIRLLKLDIMANLASETSIHTILREFRAYISSSDKQFAAATIQAIGRVACNIVEVTETCLHGLMNLLSHKNEAVVAESVIVIKKLLQLQPKENKELIRQVAKMADKVVVPSARASILWLVGEYCNIVGKIAPDILRKAAKNFANEDDTVKLQIMNLAAKLVVTNRKQTHLLCMYVLNMAKYDQNYDIRDRARFLKQLVLPAEEEETALSKYSKKILMASKPAPVLESNFKSRARWQLGSLSHYINTEANGYIPLPDFPIEAPDPSVRNVEDDNFFGRTKSTESKKKKASFFDDTDEETSSDEFYSSISGSEESGSEEETETDSEEESEDSEGESEEESEEESSEDEDALKKLQKLYLKDKVQESEEETETETETDSEEEEEEEETESSEEEPPPKPKGKTQTKTSKSPVVKPKQAVASNGPSLLDLDGWDDTPPQPSLSAGGGSGDLLRPMSSELEPTSSSDSSTTMMPSLPVYVTDDTMQLLNRISGDGLSIQYRYLRRPHVSSNDMVAIELTFENTSKSSINSISLGSALLKSGMKVNASVSLMQLAAGATANSTIGVNFNDTLQPAKFSISVGGGKKYPVQIDPAVGELLQAGRISEAGFKTLQSKLTGMHEASGKTPTTATLEDIKSTALKLANCRLVESSDTDTDCLRFCGMTFTGKLPLLITIKLTNGTANITINCEKMVFNSMLLKAFKETISIL